MNHDYNLIVLHKRSKIIHIYEIKNVCMICIYGPLIKKAKNIILCKLTLKTVLYSLNVILGHISLCAVERANQPSVVVLFDDVDNCVLLEPEFCRRLGLIRKQRSR